VDGTENCECRRTLLEKRARGEDLKGESDEVQDEKYLKLDAAWKDTGQRAGSRQHIASDHAAPVQGVMTSRRRCIAARDGDNVRQAGESKRWYGLPRIASA
jgi:hypothetical protein